MNIEAKINQLVDLMSDLVPTVDKLSRMQEKSNIEMSEMRLSNMKLADAIEKLVHRMDQVSDLEKRLAVLEKIVLK